MAIDTTRMLETADGGGYFEEMKLQPQVTVADVTMIDRAPTNCINGLTNFALLRTQ